MVLGIFQNPDVKTIQEMSKELPEIRAADLTKWPGFLERLVQVLRYGSSIFGVRYFLTEIVQHNIEAWYYTIKDCATRSEPCP